MAKQISNGINLLIATPLYPPDIGGPATYTKALEELLPGKGFSVDVVTFGEVRRLPKVIRHIAYFFKLLSASGESDIIYALDPVSVGLPAMVAAKLRGKKFLLRVAGDYAWEQGTQRFGVTDLLDTFYGKRKKHHFFVHFLQIIQRFVAGRAERVIVPSKYLKKIIVRWGIKQNRIKVIYTSTEPHAVGNKRTIRGLLQFEGKLVVSAGRLVLWKGFSALIELMPKLIKKFPDLKLFIIGSGPEEKRLGTLVDKLDLADHVVRSDMMPPDILLRYIGAADIFVLNTGYEGFSHILLETMSVGTPIVTTGIGGNLELIEHNKNGILVPYNDKSKLAAAITKVLEDRALSKQLSQNAKRTALTYSKERMVNETAAMLISI